MLKTLRDRGLRTIIFEAGNDIGGTWRWNCYPGAAVDSEVPEYEFSWPEVYETWNWKSNYPTYQELREYFDHVDRVIGVKKDCAFNSVVVGAEFDTGSGKWSVRTADGRVSKCRFLVLGTGFVCSLSSLLFGCGRGRACGPGVIVVWLMSFWDRQPNAGSPPGQASTNTAG
jgi:cation diffusion facilitator CzcD-associated flavoprotein CzcO